MIMFISTCLIVDMAWNRIEFVMTCHIELEVVCAIILCLSMPSDSFYYLE